MIWAWCRLVNSKGVFVWRWNRVDEKLWTLRENGKENFFGVYLVGGRGKKINGRPKCFLSRLNKKFSPQNRGKTKERKWRCLIDKNAHMHLHITLSIHCSSSPFIYLFIYFLDVSFPSFYVDFFFFSFRRCPFFLLLLTWVSGKDFSCTFGYAERWKLKVSVFSVFSGSRALFTGPACTFSAKTTLKLGPTALFTY